MISRRIASLKHAQYYAEVLLQADRFYQQGDMGPQEGLRLFDDNWKNIELGQQWSAAKVDSDEDAANLASEYPERGAYCLYLRQKPADRIRWLETALIAAHSKQFELVEGTLHNKIGLAATEIGDYQKGFEHLARRLDMAERLNDFEGLGEGACNLGILYDHLDMLAQAQECYQQAIAIADQISNQRIAEKATGNLGLIYLKQEEISKAIHCFERHLFLAQNNGDEWSKGNALTNLGMAYLKSRDYTKALAFFQASILINKKLGDLDGETQNLGHCGQALSTTGDLEGALLVYHEQVVLASKIRNFRREASGYWNIGRIMIEKKEFGPGLNFLYKCLDYEKSINDPAWKEDWKTIQNIEKVYAKIKKE